MGYDKLCIRCGLAMFWFLHDSSHGNESSEWELGDCQPLCHFAMHLYFETTIISEKEQVAFTRKFVQGEVPSTYTTSL